MWPETPANTIETSVWDRHSRRSHVFYCAFLPRIVYFYKQCREVARVSQLQLSENEYSLVCVVLDEAPMAPDALTSLCTRRLWLEEDEARTLTDSLLARGVLVLRDGVVISAVTREEASQTVLDRVLSDPVHRWPAPKPPPGQGPDPLPPPETPAEAPGEEEAPADQHPFFRWNNPALWTCVLLLLAAAAALVWLALPRETYPKVTVFEDGRIFSQLAEPESAAQEAAARCLEEYARDQAFAGQPIWQSFQIVSMKEYAANGDWAAVRSPVQSVSSVYDIAARHQGVVVFAQVEQACTEAVPESSFPGGAYLYRVYLSEDESGGWTAVGCESSPESQFTQVQTVEFSDGGRPFTVSIFGHFLYPDKWSAYAVTVSGGEGEQLLYLSEIPCTALTADTGRDLNEDGYPDLLLTFTTSDSILLYCLYAPEEGSFRICPELCGTPVSTFAALPGTVQYWDVPSADLSFSVHYFCRFEADGTLEELVRMEQLPTVTDEETKTATQTFRYYLHGELVREHEYSYEYDFSTLSAQTVVDIFQTNACWDELVLQAAREAGCLDLPETVADFAGGYDHTQISLIFRDEEAGVDFYTSPSHLLLIRDGGRLQVFPADVSGLRTQSTHYADLDGDGDKDLLTNTPSAVMKFSILLRRGEYGWTLEVPDLSAVAEDFNAHNSYTQTEDSLTLTYDGLYGEDSATLPCLFDEEFPPEFYLSPDNAQLNTIYEDTGLVSLCLPVLNRDALSYGNFTGFQYFVVVRILEGGGVEVVSTALATD